MSYTSVERDIPLVRAKLAQGVVSGTNLSATANAPGDQTASTVVLGQKDSSVGSTATLDIETEEEVVVIGTFTESHKIAVWINNVEYHISLDAV